MLHSLRSGQKGRSFEKVETGRTTLSRPTPISSYSEIVSGLTRKCEFELFAHDTCKPEFGLILLHPTASHLEQHQCRLSTWYQKLQCTIHSRYGRNVLFGLLRRTQFSAHLDRTRKAIPGDVPEPALGAIDSQPC